MGTNYYVHKRLTKQKIEELKSLLDEHLYAQVQDELPEPIHIGKSSGGWQFLFNTNGWRHYKTMKEMRQLIIDNVLVDEYGEEINPAEFWDMVESKQDGLDGTDYCERWDEFHPDTNPPDYVLRNESFDFHKEGYRFSKNDYFS